MCMVEDFEGFATVSGVCGVYMLLCRGEVVYVGQSVNVFARIATHHNTLQRHRKGLRPANEGPGNWVTMNVITFDTIKIKTCAKADLDKEEIVLIQKYLPKKNTFLNRPPPKNLDTLYEMPLYKELMKRAEAKQAREAPVKRRRLPRQAYRTERDYQQYRKVEVTLPHLKCLEDELTG